MKIRSERVEEMEVKTDEMFDELWAIMKEEDYDQSQFAITHLGGRILAFRASRRQG